MATTIQQLESEPDEYPDAPDGLSPAAAAIPPAVIWDRLESWCAHRWAVREITWIVEGCGEWCPPIVGAEIVSVEVWSSAGEYEAQTSEASPLGGYYLRSSGPFRVSATVGGGDVPDTVNEAYRRLAEHLAANSQNDPGLRSMTLGDASETYRYSWKATALQDSGAADLLRPYRRA